MNWKAQLEAYEAHKDWKQAIEHMEQVLKDHPDDVEAWVRMIYLLWNYIVEEPVRDPDVNLEETQKLLLTYFKISSEKFRDNPEYLFFVGLLGHVAEWVFGYGDTAFFDDMSKRACELDPNNKIYQWECELIKDKTNIFLKENADGPKAMKVREIEKEILRKNSLEVALLLSKGTLGRYILDVQLGLGTRNVKYREEILGK